MGTVTALRSPEQLARMAMPEIVTRFECMGIDGLWLRSQVRADLPFGDGKWKALNLLEEDGTLKAAVRKMLFSGIL